MDMLLVKKTRSSCDQQEKKIMRKWTVCAKDPEKDLYLYKSPRFGSFAYPDHPGIRLYTIVAWCLGNHHANRRIPSRLLVPCVLFCILHM